MRRMIRIAIADDHKLVREGLVALIRTEEKIRVLYDVSNGAELIEKLQKETKPDVILLDIEMPGVDGRQALQYITNKYSWIKVLILSMHTQLDFIHECIAKGAHGFLSKDSDFEKIVDAIYAAHCKGFYFDDVVSKALVTNVRKADIVLPNLLDTVDIEIIKLVCQGKTSKEIGEIVFLGERAVEGRRLRISKKTNTSNLVELVVYAIKNDIFKVF